MSKVADTEIKKIKHRDVERIRHHKLQKLINRFAEILPGDNSSATQCAILGKAGDFIEFMIKEFNKTVEVIEVDGYSSSQGTVASSQGRLIIDESFSQGEEQVVCKVDPELVNCDKGFPPLPSSLLSPDQEFFDFAPSSETIIPTNFTKPSQSHQWNGFDFVNHSPYPSPPATSPPLTQQFSFTQPLPPPQYMFNMDHKALQQQPSLPQPYQQPHCPSCCCYSSPNFNSDQKPPDNMKAFVSRDYLLTETLSEPFTNEPNLIWA